MKILTKLIYTACLIFTHLYANAQQSIGVDSSYANGHYLQRVDFFKKMPDQVHEVVFLGNSITEGGKWQELFPKVKHVINRGVSGDVTYGILARMDEVLSSNPDKIFLLSGINDVKRGTPNEVIVENFVRLIKLVQSKSPKTQLYIQSVLPVNIAMLPATYSKLSNEKINDLNKSLKDICNTYKVNYINLKPVFADQNGEMRKELTIDGLHLRQASYILWADHLKKIKAL